MKNLLAVITFISLIGTSAVANAADWRNDIQEAVKYSNFHRINIIAASHPEAQGEIALFLLAQAQASKSDPVKEAKLYNAATPFVSRIPAAQASKASETIRLMLNVATNAEFQKRNPQDAADLFLNSLHMSSQPNVVAYDPTLHAEVLEAANNFTKAHPQDANKKLLEEISLAQAGGAPETRPHGVINPSAE